MAQTTNEKKTTPVEKPRRKRRNISTSVICNHTFCRGGRNGKNGTGKRSFVRVATIDEDTTRIKEDSIRKDLDNTPERSVRTNGIIRSKIAERGTAAVRIEMEGNGNGSRNGRRKSRRSHNISWLMVGSGKPKKTNGMKQVGDMRLVRAFEICDFRTKVKDRTSEVLTLNVMQPKGTVSDKGI